MLEYYFGNDYAGIFGSRDATDSDALKDFRPDSNMTVVDSVKTLVAWCEANHARLVHISTGSIIGGRKAGLPHEGYKFTERVFFAGQTVKYNQKEYC